MSEFYSTDEFIEAAVNGELADVSVVVDNDNVSAYRGDEQVCDFNDAGPQQALLEVLTALGVKAEYP